LNPFKFVFLRQDHINCQKYWWRNILYINTLFPVQDMCMLWSWYLANDTQFYIIGAIILIVAIRHFKFAAATLGIFMVSAWITTGKKMTEHGSLTERTILIKKIFQGVIAYTNNHMPNTDDPLALFDKIYDKPWTRLGPYLVGMSVGWILFKTNCKIKFTKVRKFTKPAQITNSTISASTCYWMDTFCQCVALSSLRALQDRTYQSSCSSL
jgi:hypothetical protein